MVPFEWAFAESDYSAGCIYNQGIESFDVDNELTEGIFSGWFYIDLLGTWNGSVFSITVGDDKPHFFYSIRDVWVNSCGGYGNWSISSGFPIGEDVLFALNPVIYSCEATDNLEFNKFIRGL